VTEQGQHAYVPCEGCNVYKGHCEDCGQYPDAPVHAAPGTGNTEPPAEVCEHHWVVDADQMDPTGAYCSRCMVSQNQIGYVIDAAAPRTEPPATPCPECGCPASQGCPEHSGPVTAQDEPTGDLLTDMAATYAKLRARMDACTCGAAFPTEDSGALGRRALRAEQALSAARAEAERVHDRFQQLIHEQGRKLSEARVQRDRAEQALEAVRAALVEHDRVDGPEDWLTVRAIRAALGVADGPPAERGETQ
jgi:hypothetical protein